MLNIVRQEAQLRLDISNHSLNQVLDQSVAAFVTKSTRGIVPVSKIDHRQFASNNAATEIISKLSEQLNKISQFKIS